MSSRAQRGICTSPDKPLRIREQEQGPPGSYGDPASHRHGSASEQDRHIVPLRTPLLLPDTCSARRDIQVSTVTRHATPMPSPARPIPELESSTLDSEHHDEKARIYEALCHVVQRGALRRFRLHCEDVRQVQRRVVRPRREPWNYTEITEAYREPLVDGRTLVSLELWSEAEWIEIDCRSATVVEIGSSDDPEHLRATT